MLLQASDVQIKKLSEKNNEGVFEFAPLPSGFGYTLGNTLRRVLLSSMQGAAITQVKIPGVKHQFTTIPGVKEDVLEIILNLKKIVVKSHSANPIIASISKTGPGPVTAADIKVTSEVEVISPDVHIAELADKNAKFHVELVIEQGVGFVENSEEQNQKVGVVMLDALFSPVLNVSCDVEKTRRGEDVNLDKLILTIKTNGSITATAALEESATILRNFYAKFSKGPDTTVDEDIESSDTVAETTGGKDEIFIDDLNLPTRTLNALKKHGIDTLNQLAKMSDDELADIKNLGDKSLKEIQKLLKKEGLKA